MRPKQTQITYDERFTQNENDFVSFIDKAFILVWFLFLLFLCDFLCVVCPRSASETKFDCRALIFFIHFLMFCVVDAWIFFFLSVIVFLKLWNAAYCVNIQLFIRFLFRRGRKRNISFASHKYSLSSTWFLILYCDGFDGFFFHLFRIEINAILCKLLLCINGNSVTFHMNWTTCNSFYVSILNCFKFKIK